MGAWRLTLLVVCNITGIFLPGFLLVQWSHVRLRNATSQFFLAYGVGYALMAIVYAALLLLGIQKWAGWALWLISAISVLTLFIKGIRRARWDQLRSSHQDLPVLLVIFLGVLAFCHVLFQQPVWSVSQTDYQDIPYDQMYWMKNCVAATMAFPLPDLSVSGVLMHWHMFSCFNIAMLHYATGISIFCLCFSLSFVWHALLLIGGTYALARELLTSRIHVFAAMLLILLCSSWEYHTDVLYLVHLWYCTMGTPEAIAMELFGLLLLFKMTERGRIHWRLLPLVLLMVATTAGYKSPVGLILMVGMGGALVMLVVRCRAMLLPSLSVLSLIALVGIAVVMVFVASDQALSSSTSNNQIALTFRTATQPGMMQSAVAWLTGHGLEIHVTALLLAIPYILLAHPAMPLLAVVLIAVFVHRKRISLSDEYLTLALLPMVAMCLVGVGTFLAFTHYGFAQSYFIYAAIPVAVVCAMVAIDRYLGGWHRGWLYALVGCALLLMPVCALTYEQDEEFHHEARAVSHEGTSLTDREWEGLDWIRTHLPTSAVLLSNKVLAPARGNRSYVTSSYAERQVYIEGYISANLPNDHIVRDRLVLIVRYFSGDLRARAELQKEGVTHVVVYKSLSDVDRLVINWGGKTRILVFNPLSAVNISRGETLYENESIKVIKL